jgi:hypothetical protein
VYRDVVRCANGSQFTLQLLEEGQRVQVLSLASTSSSDPARPPAPIFAVAN